MYEQAITDHDELLNAERMAIDAVMDGDDMLMSLAEDGALRKVLTKAREDAASAVLELLRVDPFDGEKVRRLQWHVHRFSALAAYSVGILRDAEYFRENMSGEEFDTLRRILDDETGDSGAVEG